MRSLGAGPSNRTSLGSRTNVLSTLMRGRKHKQALSPLGNRGGFPGPSAPSPGRREDFEEEDVGPVKELHPYYPVYR